MFTVNAVSRRYGDNLILDSISCVVNAGDRIGLIGANGAGKTTLLRLITGMEQPSSGSISVAPGVTFGYLRQGFTDMREGTLGDLLDVATEGLIAASRELERSTAQFAAPDVDSDIAAREFDVATAQFDARGGYAALDELVAALDAFELRGVEFDRPLHSFSGGQKTRAGLAGLIALRPDVLILDEPTNHLDAEAQRWLADTLNGWRGAVLVVSHDRSFLDAVVSQIFWLNPLTHSLTVYPGNYSDYVAFRQHEEEEQQAAWFRQQKDIRRIEQDIRQMESRARNIENNTIDFAIRKKAAKLVRPAVVRKAKLERMLESEEMVDKPQRRWSMAATFAESGGGARDVVVLDQVSVRYGEFEALRDVSLHVRHGQRIALTGPNGSGKTTLIRVIAGEVKPASGSVRIGSGIQIGVFAQEQEVLDLERTALDEARIRADLSESGLRTFLHKYLFTGDMVHRRIAELSYGERARLMLALLGLSGTDLLLLDEPLNHLDIESRENFELALSQFGGTVIFVSHDEFAVDRLATDVVHLRDGSIVQRVAA